MLLDMDKIKSFFSDTVWERINDNYINFHNQLLVILTISVLHIQININTCMLAYHTPLFLTPLLILWSIFTEKRLVELSIDIFNIAAGGLVLLILKPNSWPGALEFCTDDIYDPPYALSFLLGDIMVFGTMLKLYIFYISRKYFTSAWLLFAISCLVGLVYVLVVDLAVYPS